MKGIAVVAAGKVEVVHDIPIPDYGEYECLVRVKACGLCNSTDLKIIQDEVPDMPCRFPAILGHEGCGEIVELGGRVRNFQVGDVVVSPLGLHQPGEKYSAMFGGMQEFAIVHDLQAMAEDSIETEFSPERYPGRKIPKEISFVDGGVFLTLKENYSALVNFGYSEGMDVLIYGDGPVCLGLASFARLRHAGFVAVVGHHQDRLDRISAVAKADIVVDSHRDNVEEKLAGRAFDLVIDAVGKTAIIKQGAKLLKSGGKVGVYGVLKSSDANFDLIRGLPNHTAVHMLNWPYREHDCHDIISDMILKGDIRPGDFYSHVMPMEDAARAIEMIEKREAYKIIFTL